MNLLMYAAQHYIWEDTWGFYYDAAYCEPLEKLQQIVDENINDWPHRDEFPRW